MSVASPITDEKKEDKCGGTTGSELSLPNSRALAAAMESPISKDGNLSPRNRSPPALILNEENNNPRVSSATKLARHLKRSSEMLQLSTLSALPWIGWAFVYTTALLFFFSHRCTALKSLVTMYSSSDHYKSGVKMAALGLGFLEDFVCTTYFACALWVFDSMKNVASKWFQGESSSWKCVYSRRIGMMYTFFVSWLLFFAMMAPFVADLLLVQIRDMRFTFDLISIAISEKEYVSAAPIATEEVTEGYMSAASLATVSTFFAIVRTWTSWGDITSWTPTHIVSRQTESEPLGVKVTAVKGAKYVELCLEEGSSSPSMSADEITDKRLSPKASGTYHKPLLHRVLQAAIILAGLVIVPVVTVAISSVSSPLVAYTALNATLNELFGHALQPTIMGASATEESGDLPEVEKYIHPTEEHKLFGRNSLYRRTTGFRGDLAFDVSIKANNPPNVLIIGVESFRFQDSRYLVGKEDPSNLFKGTNMTITPNFDRWAKRGVALRNMWSSSPTSRSLESLLFAQIPYDSQVKTGITGGRKGTNLSGLPQFFSGKGYETFFSTGSPTGFENWNVFLPSHGFETVWDNHDLVRLAEGTLGIKSNQWFGDEHRGFTWGVHDDINLQLLGDLLVNKTKEQRDRVARGDPKTPLFITHYTISSHDPYEARPTWYDEMEKPDFSPLYEGEKHEDRTKRYYEMRYFTDMQLGQFLDRMAEQGILNDTIVVISGDHGQAPEADRSNTHEESVTRIASAIIAEGRLGKSAGLVIEDAAEQYDILNTLADITGVPKGGFLQTGVGRSLKRKVKFGERVVFSNDPSRKMAIVRGHRRLRYEKAIDSVMLHDTESDHAMTTDLFPGLSVKEQNEWKAWAEYGRRVTAYFTKRWDDNCLAATKCS
ncbi:unnamed protein product [Phytophthora lilii]|uniref:Unnamed protein product n=1 Tax=Phytophthora lilii TaxID=2077276 RepID=A0A9W6X6T6_9STRA|nr:unnamed protein product [Phytophthora lilii]